MKIEMLQDRELEGRLRKAGDVFDVSQRLADQLTSQGFAIRRKDPPAKRSAPSKRAGEED